MPQHELILNFHGVGVPHRGADPEERRVWISRENFAAWLDRIDTLRNVQPTPIRITFDDGNASDVKIALPELCKRNLTATFFLCSGRLQAPEYLDRAAVRDLLDAGMEVGSHGMHHRDWRTLDAGALEEEIGTARRMLEDVCGRTIAAAAIPFGSYNRRVLKRLRAERFACVYTSDRGLARQHAWLRPRNTLAANSTQDDLARLLVGMPRPEAILRAAYRLYKGLR
jgi:peptidoglycan/xylan/chitin deacetylase (PgdA/CDA1 family)